MPTITSPVIKRPDPVPIPPAYPDAFGGLAGPVTPVGGMQQRPSMPVPSYGSVDLTAKPAPAYDTGYDRTLRLIGGLGALGGIVLGPDSDLGRTSAAIGMAGSGALSDMQGQYNTDRAAWDEWMQAQLKMQNDRELAASRDLYRTQAGDYDRRQDQLDQMAKEEREAIRDANDPLRAAQLDKARSDATSARVRADQDLSGRATIGALEDLDAQIADLEQQAAEAQARVDAIPDSEIFSKLQAQDVVDSLAERINDLSGRRVTEISKSTKPDYATYLARRDERARSAGRLEMAQRRLDRLVQPQGGRVGPPMNPMMAGQQIAQEVETMVASGELTVEEAIQLLEANGLDLTQRRY